MVDRDTMFNLVHLRGRLAGFYRLVDKVYKEDAFTKVVLDSLTSAKENWRDKFNNVLSSIYYPAVEGKNALQFYANYTKWAEIHAKEQLEIESAVYSPNEYIKIVVPEAKQSQSDVVHASSFGTAHDFFPTQARSRKKKSVDASSDKPLVTRSDITASASSITTS
jgi:hypothetical protein